MGPSDNTLSNYNDFGLDVTLLVYKLTLTPTQRLIEHQIFMDQLEELQQAKIVVHHDQVQRTPPNSSPTQG